MSKMNHSFYSIPESFFSISGVYAESEMNGHGHDEIVLVLVRSEFRKFFWSDGNVLLR